MLFLDIIFKKNRVTRFNKCLFGLFSCLIGAQLTLLHFVDFRRKEKGKKTKNKKQKELKEFAKGGLVAKCCSIVLVML